MGRRIGDCFGVGGCLGLLVSRWSGLWFMVLGRVYGWFISVSSLYSEWESGSEEKLG